MSLFKRALDRIEENKLKQYNCIPFEDKLPRISEFLSGIQKGRYHIVTGTSGSGKSQLTDDIFVFTPFEFVRSINKKLKLKIFYFSLELDGETKMHQWMAKRIYENYGIRTSVDILRSVGKNRINDNIHMVVKETYGYFDELEKILNFYDGSYSPSNIIHEIENYSNLNGKYIDDIYVPNDSDEYVIIIVDHASLLVNEKGLSTKLSIEKLSNYFVQAKNKYKYIPVLIQQQSAEKENVDHYKASKLEPSKDGLAESKLTYNDADIAMGIFQPQKHEIKNYRGYDILLLGDNYRNLSVFKNRFGTGANINIGMYFDGAVNYFKELPKKEIINVNHYDMVKKKNPHW